MLNYVTLTGELPGAANAIAIFTRGGWLTDATDELLLPPVPEPVILDGNGKFSVSLLATDNSAPTPSGWTWTVEVLSVPSVAPYSFSFFLPFTGGATQDISALAQVSPVTPSTAYVPAPILVNAPTGATATDTGSVQAAIAKLGSGNGTLIFQDGTYQVDGNALVIRNASNFTVKGSGATIITQAPNTASKPNNTTGDLLVIADCTDFRVEALTLDGLRDTLSPMTPLTASASSGQPSVTVAAGQGSRYQVGQNLILFGGLGTADSNLSDGFSPGHGTPLVVLSITPGGGAGGGDLVTFTTNLGNTYAQISSTPFSDGFGPYAYAGAYLTPYQCANLNSVAGRSLSGEDQQCGLHLLTCQRFTVSRVTGRNLWESPIKLGSGFAPSNASLADACANGTVTDCTGYHAYDQGVSVWLSRQITVKGCSLNATGWAGISFTASDDCVATGNQISNSYYRVPTDNSSGTGIAIEGGLHNLVKGNVIMSPYSDGMRLRTSPLGWGAYGATAKTTSTFLAAQTAAGTSVQVSSTSGLLAGYPYSLIDGAQTEAVTIATVVDSTHVTFTAPLMFSHTSGTPLGQRIGQENVVEGNTIFGPQTGAGINLQQTVRATIKNNVIRNWSLTSGSGSGVVLAYSNSQLLGTEFLGGDGSHVEGNVIAGGLNSGIVVNAISNLLLRGNRIYGLQNNQAAINLKGATDSVVSENYISDIENGQGIICQAATGTKTNFCSRLTISGNDITRCSNEGIISLSSDSLTITGNVVSSCGGHAGINLRGTTNSLVADNICNSNKADGIQLEDNSAVHSLSNRVVGNTTRDDGSGVNVTTGAAMTQQHGIVESGSSDNNVFTANECDSNAVDQLTTVGVSSVDYSNIISGVVSSPGVNSTSTGPVNITTTTETVVASITVPANLPAGATYRLTAWGTISIGGTAGNLTGHARIGGGAGPQLGNLTSPSFTASTSGFWRFSGLVQIQTPGVSATWAGEFEQSALVGAATSNGPGAVAVTRDSTVAQQFVITLTLGSATSSAVCTASIGERVA